MEIRVRLCSETIPRTQSTVQGSYSGCEFESVLLMYSERVNHIFVFSGLTTPPPCRLRRPQRGVAVWHDGGLDRQQTQPQVLGHGRAAPDSGHRELFLLRYDLRGERRPQPEDDATATTGEWDICAGAQFVQRQRSRAHQYQSDECNSDGSGRGWEGGQNHRHACRQ